MNTIVVLAVLFLIVVVLLAGHFVRTLPAFHEGRVYEVRVDYADSRDELITRCNFDEVDMGVHKFPIPQDNGVTRLQMRVIGFYEDMPLPGVNRVAAENSLRPASVIETLSFAAQYPDVFRRFTIVSTGTRTVIGTNQCVICFGHAGKLIRLFLGSWVMPWSLKTGFLMVEKHWR